MEENEEQEQCFLWGHMPQNWPRTLEIGSTYFVIKCIKKILFLAYLAKFQPWSCDFGTRTPPVLWNFVEMVQAQKP